MPSVLEEAGPPMGQPSTEDGDDSSENENEGTQNGRLLLVLGGDHFANDHANLHLNNPSEN